VSPSFVKSFRATNENQSVDQPRSARKPFAATGLSPSRSPRGTDGDRVDRALPGRLRPSQSPGTTRSEHAATTPVEESASAAAPKMVVRDFSALRPSFNIGELMRDSPDKSFDESAGDQDQSTKVSAFTATAEGVSIQIASEGTAATADFPDGFRWTQVIDTNAPKGGATSPYVDPHPNDDTKPFYYTDAEEKSFPNLFTDSPSRSAPATGTTTWKATLGLDGVNEAKKNVKGFAYLTYGFTVDTAGKVTTSAPTATTGASHRSQLKAEFADWNFS
jgi:hypothetical protein